MTGLTDIQQQVLDAIRTHIVEKGYPPSVRDVCDAVGLQSSSTGHHHLKALQRKGLIVRDPDVPRGLRVVGMKTVEERVDELTAALGEVVDAVTGHSHPVVRRELGWVVDNYRHLLPERGNE